MIELITPPTIYIYIYSQVLVGQYQLVWFVKANFWQNHYLRNILRRIRLKPDPRGMSCLEIQGQMSMIVNFLFSVAQIQQS